MTLIARRQNRARHRPDDADGGIVPRDADLAFRIVERRALVLDLRDRARDAEAVCEAFGDVALQEVAGRERHAHPAAERRRADANVHRDVEDLAFDHAYEFALRLADLQVKSTQRAGNGA